MNKRETLQSNCQSSQETTIAEGQAFFLTSEIISLYSLFKENCISPSLKKKKKKRMDAINRQNKQLLEELLARKQSQQ